MALYPPPPYGGFQKGGWYALSYQESIEAVGGDLQSGNEYYYLYAENSTETWYGDYKIEVSNPPFNQCSTDNSNCTRTVGFFQLDINGDNDYILQFTP